MKATPLHLVDYSFIKLFLVGSVTDYFSCNLPAVSYVADGQMVYALGRPNGELQTNCVFNFRNKERYV